ncbi:MAG: glycolate oxidase subunit GlcE, partial [Pseudomonadota bacterium]
MGDISDLDIESDLVEQVAALSSTGAAAVICGNGSKHFYGESVAGHTIEVAAHSGIIDYDPAELVITLKAGCRLKE